MAKRDTLKYVEQCMDSEGLHYCFTRYSYFDTVKDKKFHSLRTKYLEYAELLEKYIREHAGNENDLSDVKKEKQKSESDDSLSYDSSSGDDVDSSEDEQGSSDDSTISDSSSNVD